jgi:hypothetical protein
MQAQLQWHSYFKDGFFNLAEFCVRNGIFLCLIVISRVELIRKDKEKFRSARKIPQSEKPRLK